jgi:hypothetical protein
MPAPRQLGFSPSLPVPLLDEQFLLVLKQALPRLSPELLKLSVGYEQSVGLKLPKCTVRDFPSCLGSVPGLIKYAQVIQERLVPLPS